MNAYEEAHVARLRAMAGECAVLLKKDGQFPLPAPCDVALYGGGARNTLKGGTGSGDVNARHFSTVEEGLERAGFRVTTKTWLDGYAAIAARAHRAFVEQIKERAKQAGVPALLLGMGAVMPEPTYELPLEDRGDAAIYVLSRVSGEGADRTDAPGDFRLTETEIRDILFLNRRFEKFLLALNVGGPVDLSPIAGEVKNILLLSQLGMTVGDTLADLVLGRESPSGRLAATWAALQMYPNVGDFGLEDDTRYREGIFVGYRWFDSAGKTPLFPFGYGLGWTDFTLSCRRVWLENSSVHVEAEVRNVGAHPGKTVAQVYVGVPAGRLAQPPRALAAFQKTGTLLPGEAETLALSFDLKDMAGFDEAKNARVLEAGDYLICLGAHARDTKIVGLARLQSECVTETLANAGGDADFDDWRPTSAAPGAYPESAVILPLMSVKPFVRSANTDRTAQSMPLTLDEKINLCVGKFNESASISVIGASGQIVAGAAGETTDKLEQKGVSRLVLADGPAGLRLSRLYGRDEKGAYPIGDAIPAAVLDFVDPEKLAALGIKARPAPQNPEEVHEQYCSAIPIGTALAQSWNPDLARAMGDLIGEEMTLFGVHLWLAPAMNLQRHPLCGRNFEYYSEDPRLTGKIAAAITRGVQAHAGRGVTIKHFCCNNQETNRFRSNSVVSRRALRDIYLKGFEICVREGAPRAVMSSYNLLNGVHTCERKDLLTDVLRGEWGFQGIVMTDWSVTGGFPTRPGKHPLADAGRCVAAGNDLIMPGGAFDVKAIGDALESGALTEGALDASAARILQTICALS